MNTSLTGDFSSIKSDHKSRDRIKVIIDIIRNIRPFISDYLQSPTKIKGAQKKGWEHSMTSSAEL